MKKLTFLMCATQLVASAAFGQIKIGTDGHVGIGSYAPTSSYNLILGSANFKQTTRFDGQAIFYQPVSFNSYISTGMQFYSSYSDLMINSTGIYYGIGLYPESNNYSQVGRSDRAFKYVYAYNYPSVSDRRQKEHIRDIKNALDIVLEMKGVLYDLKKEYSYTDDMITSPEVGERLEKDRKDIYGFLAQDLEEVAPEVVNYDDSSDVYTINYMQIIPLLVEALKEQQEMIIKLDEKIKDKDEKSAEEPDIETQKEATLGKNRPNPFNENTTIEYYLPAGVQNATMYVYDLQGKQLKSIQVTGRENGYITIYGSELQPGIYHYSLIADGQLIGIEKMVLTD